MADAAPIAAIPLHCSICPKVPKFSDLSHLLTHVAAKGHLSNQFKASVRTSTDHAARELLERYNHWYQVYGIEQLLAERMNKKDARSARVATESEPVDGGTPSYTSSQSTPFNGQSTARELPSELLDPRLVQQDIKLEHPRPTDSPLGSASHHRAYAPRMHLWPTSNEHVVDNSTAADYTPVPSSAHALHESPFPSQLTGLCPETAFSSRGASADLGDTGEAVGQERKEGGEMQLKGVYWPGMSMFDSANPEMKRKRNQKKDGSLAAQLEVCSTRVEATERMFDSAGDLQKERPIARLLEDSPIKQEKDMFKKPRLTTKRLPLVETNVNIPKLDRSAKTKLRSFKRERGDTTSALPSLRLPHTPRSGSVSSISTYSGFHLESSADVDDDFRLTYGSPRMKDRPFAIFQDSSEPNNDLTKKLPDPTRLESVFSFRSPVGQRMGIHHEITFLNSGYSTHSPAHSVISDPFTDGGVHRAGDDLAKGALIRHHSKENAAPAVAGLGDEHTSQWAALDRNPRFFSVEGAHPPPFVQSVPRILESSPSLGETTSVYGFSGNPLAINVHREQLARPFGLDGAWSPRSPMHLGASGKRDATPELYFGTQEVKGDHEDERFIRAVEQSDD